VAGYGEEASQSELLGSRADIISRRGTLALLGRLDIRLGSVEYSANTAAVNFARLLAYPYSWIVSLKSPRS
jgi:hypothetical protein